MKLPLINLPTQKLTNSHYQLKNSPTQKLKLLFLFYKTYLFLDPF